MLLTINLVNDNNTPFNSYNNNLFTPFDKVAVAHGIVNRII